MKQLRRLSQDGVLMENGRVVKVNLFECHDLVANVSPMGNIFCPWWKFSKKTIHMVINEIKIQDGDTISSISKFYAMPPSFILVSYT